jgi:catalase-peroxidase
MGFGWINSMGEGHGVATITSGIEGAWTTKPTTWDNEYFKTLMDNEWELVKSPAGAQQWVPKGGAMAGTVPDAHDTTVRHAPMMTTADLGLKFDPEYAKISKRFAEDPEALADAFARAWYKLTHRDMGPRSRYLGKLVAAEELIWQDPIPKPSKVPGAKDVAGLKATILASGLSVSQLVATAWASASTFRGTDKRGGANGGRIRLAPQKDWEVNNPTELAKALAVFDKMSADTGYSVADLIVLGGCAAVEKAAKDAGHDITVPFTPGRTDASQEQTDVESFSVLEPQADGFRNYQKKAYTVDAEHVLVDKAQLLQLSAPEMTALVGGLRVLGANTGGERHGVLTARQGKLTNDFFTNLLDMDTEWVSSADKKGIYEGRDRKSGQVKWMGTRVDLVFGSNSQLRALAEVYAQNDGGNKFVNDFVKSWSKVMNLDRFDLKK